MMLNMEKTRKRERKLSINLQEREGKKR